MAVMFLMIPPSSSSLWWFLFIAADDGPERERTPTSTEETWDEAVPMW